MKYSIALLAAITLLSGCASFNQKCKYYPDGVLEFVRTRSTVLGTGETEAVSNECADISYSTLDTGISDNGKDTVLGLGELAAAGASGGGTTAVKKLSEAAAD